MSGMLVIITIARAFFYLVGRRHIWRCTVPSAHERLLSWADFIV